MNSLTYVSKLLKVLVSIALSTLLLVILGRWIAKLLEETLPQRIVQKFKGESIIMGRIV